ncbi:MAG: spermidine synthase, partial [Syntrophomonadaceae bacterium]|nr:spermidine synthase [Syntrophomonadaceae bacterium]
DEEGMLVVQSESPMFYADYFQNTYKNMANVFPITQVYTASIPTYVSGPWTFTVGSKKHRADNIADNKTVPSSLRYYNKEIHKAAFALPEFMRQMLE